MTTAHLTEPLRGLLHAQFRRSLHGYRCDCGCRARLELAVTDSNAAILASGLSDCALDAARQRVNTAWFAELGKTPIDEANMMLRSLRAKPGCPMCGEALPMSWRNSPFGRLHYECDECGHQWVEAAE